MADDAAIVFTPSGLRGRFPKGTPVLQAARALGVDVDSVCGGRGICGRCQVTPVEGEFAKHGIVSRGEHLSAFSDPERAYSGRKPMQAGRRLSCSAKIQGDLVIDVPADSQVHRQVVRKAVEAVAIELDPAI
ncbi:MAG TPA: 2Fe-2S iron-sulfur cluster-binding protein, partial [Stellaceae bacterium]|nr:2Fe-2S iron-sulfur cluster-binding protein [Stellaceae bacterium]